MLLDFAHCLLAGLAEQVALAEFVPQVERLVAEQVVLVLLELGQVVVELLLLEQVGRWLFRRCWLCPPPMIVSPYVFCCHVEEINCVCGSIRSQTHTCCTSLVAC